MEPSLRSGQLSTPGASSASSQILDSSISAGGASEGGRSGRKGGTGAGEQAPAAASTATSEDVSMSAEDVCVERKGASRLWSEEDEDTYVSDAL